MRPALPPSGNNTCTPAHTNTESRLVLFTDAYPYGTQESFVGLELPYLQNVFPNITIIPRSFGNCRTARSIPAGIDISPPIFASNNRLYRLLSGLFNTAPMMPVLKALYHERLFTSPGRLIRWFEAASTSRRISSRTCVQDLIQQDPPPTVYFYWGAGAAWALPAMPLTVKAMCRFHGFDVYEDRQENRGCMPFQGQILERLRWGACISQHGLAHLQNRHPQYASKLSVERLGVPPMPRAHASTDGVFRILSCSRMVNVKRLDRLAEAILQLDFPVEWRHIGDGPCRDTIQTILKSAPSNIRSIFTGHVCYEDIYNTYRDIPIDIFVLTSESEGIPVSIMEALGAGVPVLATAVGGIPEIVDDAVGHLLSPDADADEIANALRKIRNSPQKRKQWALAAKERWKERVHAEHNFRAFTSQCSAL